MYKSFPGNFNRIFLTSGFIGTVLCLNEHVIIWCNGHRLEVV